MTENSSQQIVETLLEDSRELNPKLELDGIVLPVSFEKSFVLLKKKIEEFVPNYVIGLGLEQKSKSIAIERIGVNIMDASIPDNDGVCPVDRPIVAGAADGIFSRLPFKAMLGCCVDAGVACRISGSAGTYVCNYVMYSVLFLESSGPSSEFKSGFIHIPPLSTMAFEDTLKGVSAILRGVL